MRKKTRTEKVISLKFKVLFFKIIILLIVFSYKVVDSKEDNCFLFNSLREKKKRSRWERKREREVFFR